MTSRIRDRRGLDSLLGCIRIGNFDRVSMFWDAYRVGIGIVTLLVFA